MSHESADKIVAEVVRVLEETRTRENLTIYVRDGVVTVITEEDPIE